jgi:ADP-ribose pyrophosphatase YjhB (NUDIX family)
VPYAALVSAVGPLGRPAAAWLRVYRFLAWLTQPKYTLGSMVAVCRGDELLLVRQRLRTPSRWGLPGGFQKTDEDGADAARRELREEVGLDLAVRPEDLAAHYRQPWARHLDSLYVVPLERTGRDSAGAEPNSFEIVETAWFRRDALPALTREAALALAHLPGVRPGV